MKYKTLLYVGIILGGMTIFGNTLYNQIKKQNTSGNYYSAKESEKNLIRFIAGSGLIFFGGIKLKKGLINLLQNN